ncbi:Hypothetical protein, putative [Bodo saltans]|uniref:Uncharacterized protein n=1 Tax=Bodo saltans TaxID=75058 RepID=A0A0S4JTQ5_BODSA|nr:Hypothetical protein, putative [Bodo saltans]|eukprot:CUG93768.1 Hypothetical protein, putative [Bodo saltans]
MAHYGSPLDESQESYSNGDVVTFLHRAGERYKEHLELLRRQRIEEERRLGPGIPRVSPFAHEWSATTTRKSEAVENRLMRLHQKRQEKLESARERSVQDRAAKEMEEVQQRLHLTEMGKGHTHRDPIAVTERFLDDHRKNIKRLTQESIQRELQTMQPGPQVTALAATQHTAERKKGLSIHDHLMNVERERRQRLYDAVEKKNEPVHTFHPNITRRAQEAGGDAKVEDRLYQVGRSAPVYDETYERECTFRPRTNQAYAFVDPLQDLSVHERLSSNARVQPRTEEKEASRDPVLSMSFKPKISKKSEKIVAQKREKLQGTPAAGRSPTSRLNEQQTLSSAAVTDEVDDAFTFKPMINRRSAALYAKKVKGVMATNQSFNDVSTQSAHHFNKHHMGAAPPNPRKLTPQEMLWNLKAQEKEKFLEGLKRDLEAREVEECSFTPNASSVRPPTNSSDTFEPDVFAERENLWVLHRERQLEQLKNDLDQRSLEECTFHPVVHDEVPIVSSSVPNAVGFEQHLKRQQEARSRRAEDERRSTTPAARSRSGPTIPKPFLLGPERERHRIARESDSITALRPPLSFDEWSHMRRELDDAPEEFYDDAPHAPQPTPYRHHHPASHQPVQYVSDYRSDDETTFIVRKPHRNHYGAETPNSARGSRGGKRAEKKKNALRPPLSFDEWSHMRRELDDAPEEFYDDAPQPTPTPYRHHPAPHQPAQYVTEYRSDDETTFIVRKPQRNHYGAGAPNSARGSRGGKRAELSLS